MNCKFCGAELNEDAKFCVKCGNDLYQKNEINDDSILLAEDKLAEATEEGVNEVTADEPSAGVQEKESDKKINSFSLIELIAGIVLIIVGIVTVTNTGVSISSTSFGGDFYTYSYRGIVACANLLADINKSAGWIISAFGLSFVFAGLKGLKK